MNLAGNVAQAASVSASLNVNEKSKSTACLGNTTNKYNWSRFIGVTIKKEVQFVLYEGASSNKCTRVTKKVYMEPGEDGQTTVETLKNSSSTLAKVIMYGNDRTNPETGCIASTVLANKK